MRTDAVRISAAREVAGALLPSPFAAIGTDGPDTPCINIETVSCSECQVAPGRTWSRPFRDSVLDHGEGWPTLSILDCEVITARAVLPTVLAAIRFNAARTARFRSRALAVQSADLAGLVESEQWVDALLTDAPTWPGPGPWTLPAATRPYRTTTTSAGYRDDLTPRPFGPHPPAEYAVLVGPYRARRAIEIERAGMPVRSGQERAPWRLPAP